MTEGYPRSLEGELGYQLDELVAGMRDYGGNGPVIDASYRFRPQLDIAQELVQRLRGRTFQGETWSSGYYAGPYEDGGLQYRLVGPARNHPHRFEGILQGMEEMPVRGFRTKTLEPRLCLLFHPLYLTYDTGLTAHYAERGWTDQLRHPFARPDLGDEELWLEVYYLRQGSVAPLDFRAEGPAAG